MICRDGLTKANFFLIFVILTSSMGDSAVGFPPGTILFMVFEYIYIALILMCFVLYILFRV
jgi:chitin synthase